ncbi:aminopeptidase N-like [Glandiceps talaboti]
MAKKEAYDVSGATADPAKGKGGVFVKYPILFIVIILLLMLLIIVSILVYFLHPGWQCSTTDGLPTVQPQARKPFEGRLPDTLKPTNYNIKIQPYLDEEDGAKRFLFDGEVDISLNCEKSTNVITLHALKLNIDEDTVRVNEIDTNEDIGVKDISTDEEYDFFIVKTKKKLQSGKQYKISMEYVGMLNNSDVRALYLSSYQVGNETRYTLKVITITGLNMAREEIYVEDEGLSDSEKQRNGMFVKYSTLFIAVFLILVLFVVVIIMVYFLHPGWGSSTLSPSPTQPVGPYDGLPTVQPHTRKPFEGRLPDTLKPTNYRIKIQPYLDEEDGDKRFLFDGEVDISMNCEKSTNVITLHALKLNIDEDTVRVNEIDTNEDIGVKDISTDEEYDFFIVKTEKKLQSGKKYNISMNFVGLLNNSDARALYLSSYQAGNETRYVVVSKLEPTYSRRVFPSFDEPAMKATFDIIIKHRTIRSALSNMPVIRNETDGDWNTAYFDTTPIMSTYLVAVVVSDFVYKEKTTKSGVKFRVWAMQEMIHTTDFSLEFGVATLDYFEEMWNISYSLPKLDMVALPVFTSGAMENWGLVTYTDIRMYYDKEVNPPSRAQRVARIIAHELTHNWFGNLVTMAWWGDTWLKEGFARHFEMVAVDHIKPDYEMNEQFYQDIVTFKSFNNDASSATHPTVQPDIGWYAEMRGQFSSTSYERGSQIIMMMRSFLEDTVLFEGFTDYLKKHLYGNVYSDDLWAALTETALESDVNIDMKEVMDPWLLQLGFPVVTITRKDDTTATIEQKMFVLDSEDEIPDAPGDLDYTWNIPLTYVISSEMIPYDNPTLTWMNRTSTETINLNGATADDWVLGNIYQHGYYRVNYDLDNWNKLISQLGADHEKIPIQNRAALIDDVFNLARSGDVGVVLAFEVADYLRNEDNYSPWKVYMSDMKYISKLLEMTPSYGYLELYSQELIKPLYEKDEWKFEESDSDDINHVKYHVKVLAIKRACEVNYEKCVKEVKDIFSEWTQDTENNQIRSDVREVAMCAAIRHGGQDEWRFAYQEVERTKDTSLKDDITTGLACTQNVWLLQKYLDDSYQLYLNRSTEAATEYVIPSPLTIAGEALDFYKVIGKVRDQSAVGHMIAEEFVMSHFDELLSTDGGKAFSLVWGLADKMNSEMQLMKFEDFARKYNDMPGDQVKEFYKAQRKVKANIRWMDKNYDKLEQWLKSKTRDY